VAAEFLSEEEERRRLMGRYLIDKHLGFALYSIEPVAHR
jgi:hypothetical protein